MSQEFKYEIAENLAILGRSGTVTKALTITSFGDGAPRYDIRGWYKFGESAAKPLKGLQLTAEEVAALKAALNTRDDIPG